MRAWAAAACVVGAVSCAPEEGTTVPNPVTLDAPCAARRALQAERCAPGRAPVTVAVTDADGLQAALADACPGDTVEIAGEVAADRVTLPAGITARGGTLASACVVCAGARTTLDTLAVAPGAGQAALDTEPGARLTLTGVTVRGGAWGLVLREAQAELVDVSVLGAAQAVLADRGLLRWQGGLVEGFTTVGVLGDGAWLDLSDVTLRGGGAPSGSSWALAARDGALITAGLELDQVGGFGVVQHRAEGWHVGLRAVDSGQVAVAAVDAPLTLFDAHITGALGAGLVAQGGQGLDLQGVRVEASRAITAGLGPDGTPQLEAGHGVQLSQVGGAYRLTDVQLSGLPGAALLVDGAAAEPAEFQLRAVQIDAVPPGAVGLAVQGPTPAGLGADGATVGGAPATLQAVEGLRLVVPELPPAADLEVIR